MAIVRNPALSMDASGNLGGICYSRWQGRQVARAARTGVIVPSPAQAAAFGIVRTVAQAWSGTLTALQRSRWTEAAKVVTFPDRFGDPRAPGGYFYFLKLSATLLQIGLAIRTSPPVSATPYLVVSLTTTWEPGGPDLSVRLNNPSGYAAPNTVQYWRAGPFANAGRTAQLNEYRYMTYKRPAAAWKDFGVVSGQWYWYRARGVTLYGQTGAWFQAHALIP